MADINLNFKTLRVNLRKYGSEISEDVFERFHPATMNVGDEICVFCMSTSKLTKEHVIPKWLFEKEGKESVVFSSVNRRTQSYNKFVIPACSECNNTILAEIEKLIIKIVENMEIDNRLTDDDLSNIIRWLEILDYKFQVYDCRRRYIKYGNSEYDPHWGDLPVSVMRHFIDMNPFKALDYIRRSQHRITVKSKSDRIDSLVIFWTTRPHLNFFSQPDEYVYVSFPMVKISMFYFLRKKFEDRNDAAEQARYYIENVSKS
jgi:hypothetical protein